MVNGFDWNPIPDLFEFSVHINDFLLNALLLIPFGVFLKMLADMDRRWLIAAVYPFLIEFMQPFLMVGVFSMTTVVFMYAGVLVGYVGMWIVCRHWDKRPWLNSTAA